MSDLLREAGESAVALLDMNRRLRDELERERSYVANLARAYDELRSTVLGECPSLLNEDSGASAELIDLDIEAIQIIDLRDRESS